MALIDIDKFVASIMYRWNNPEMKTIFNDMKYSLIDQGLEYKDGEIVKNQRRVSAEAKETGYGESEDERIKKEITNIIMQSTCNTEEEFYRKRELIDWLEKQGEQENKVNSYKITFEDVLALECAMKTVKITKGGNELYEMLDLLYSKIHNAYLLEKQGEQKSVGWSEEDERAFHHVLSVLEEYGGEHPSKSKFVCNWLKSIKVRMEGDKV